MPRLLPCPSCARHVLASERACPFCGAARVDATASVLTTALLGLTLVAGVTACDSDSKPAPTDKQAKPDATQPADQILVPAEPEPTPPTTAIPVEPEPPVEPPPPIGEDTAGPPVEGTPDNQVDAKPDAKPDSKPDSKLDEQPRPPKTYGGPPKPKFPSDPDFE